MRPASSEASGGRSRVRSRACAAGARLAVCSGLLGALVLGCGSLSYPETSAPATASDAGGGGTSDANADVTAWTTSSAKGRDAMRQRDYAAAEAAYMDALAATGSMPVHDARVRTALGNVVRVAAARQAAGEWTEADRILDTVLDAAARGRLADFETVAPVLARQARQDVRIGETDRATRLYETALLLHGARDPAGTDERLEIEERLGRIDLGRGRLDDAEPLLLSAWRGLQIRHGPDSLPAARAGVAVAELRRAQGDLAAADAVYTRALTAQAGSIADTLEYAVNQSRLAAVRLALGRDEDAVRLATSSLAVLEARDAHPTFLIETLDTLGTAETRLGLLPAARGHFAQALALYDGADSLVRAEQADLLLHVAELERREGDPVDADALVERAARERAAGRLPD